MEIIVTVAVLAALVLSTASFVHRSRQRAFLTKPLKVDKSLKRRAARELGVDGAAVAGVSVFDVLYNTTKLDPHTLRGINHLHHAREFESLGDLMAFMKGEIIKSEPGEGAWRQMVHKYKGYTGEEEAFDNLSSNGHGFDVPDSGTAEGLDVTVDGKTFNVKVTDNPGYIQDHLDKHPDIDVITNREMADAFADNPRVVIDPDLSSQEAFHSTADTLEGMADLGDFLDGIPLIALAINTARNGRKVYKGDVDLVTAAEHTVLDTAAAGGGGTVGGKAGLAVGLALAPMTGGISAVVIPAATTLVGTLVGVFTGKGISGWIKERHLRAAVASLQSVAAEFRDEFLRLYSTVVGVSDSFFEVRLELVRERVAEEGIVKRSLFPSTETVFYNMAAKELRAERQAGRRFYADLHRTVQEAEPSEGGMILFEQGVEILNEVEPLPEHYAAIEEKIKVVETEKRKLK